MGRSRLAVHGIDHSIVDSVHSNGCDPAKDPANDPGLMPG